MSFISLSCIGSLIMSVVIGMAKTPPEHCQSNRQALALHRFRPNLCWLGIPQANRALLDALVLDTSKP
jgi:hypothetical protein